MSDDLPNGIPKILQHLALSAAAYDNPLKWNEVAMLKADLMNVRHRWIGVSAREIGARCRSLGMREEDVQQIVSLVTKSQAGKRLIPQATYRKFSFAQPVDAEQRDRAHDPASEE